MGITVIAAYSALFAVASFATAPGVADAAAVREVRIAERSAAGTTPGVSGLQAGYGVVAWVESRSRGDVVERRIAARSGGPTLRRPWSRRAIEVVILRRVDQRTGRVVVRVVQRCDTSGGSSACRERLLSPATLRETKSQFSSTAGQVRTAPGALDPTDGATRVLGETVVSDAPVVVSEPQLMRPSECRFRIEGQATPLPSVPDCARPGIAVRGGLVITLAEVPSRTAPQDGYGAFRFDALDLDRIGDGWRAIGTTRNGKGGGIGIQRFCVLDDAVATLSGSTDLYGLVEDAPWSVTVKALRSGGADWTSTAPQLTDADASGRVQIACSGKSIYAQYPVEGSKPATTRIVRLLAPR